MTTTTTHEATQASYGKCIATSKRVRWDIDADVLRGREFDYDLRFLRWPGHHTRSTVQ